MFKIRKISRFIISATTLLLLGGTSHLVSADGQVSRGGVVVSTVTEFPRALQFNVTHNKGLRRVSWYNADTTIFEDAKNYSGCPKSDKIVLPNGLHLFHGHYVVVVPCDSPFADTETFETTDEYPESHLVLVDSKFLGFGNLVGNDNSNMVMQMTDVNLDGIPDIVVIDNSSGRVTPTVMLGNGDGTFERINNSVVSEFDANTSAPSATLAPLAESFQRR